MTDRYLHRLIPSQATSDGAGVKLRRSLGQNPHTRLDPFLMLDEFSSDKADDYIAGFPAHPHRGFETVTYMLAGHMLHEDHLGHQGELRGGGAQWMTAGRGIIHSEMPQQAQGLLRGFQLWINLPAAEKMKPAAYQDIQAEAIPELKLPNGGVARVIAGSTESAGERVDGPIQGLSTAPVFIDLRFPAGGEFRQAIPPGHHAFIYPYDGAWTLLSDGAPQALPAQQAAVLSDGDALHLSAGPGAGCLLLAARPIGEPVVQYGPFVMNTKEEIEQALDDYRRGSLV